MQRRVARLRRLLRIVSRMRESQGDDHDHTDQTLPPAPSSYAARRPRPPGAQGLGYPVPLSSARRCQPRPGIRGGDEDQAIAGLLHDTSRTAAPNTKPASANNSASASLPSSWPAPMGPLKANPLTPTRTRSIETGSRASRPINSPRARQRRDPAGFRLRRTPQRARHVQDMENPQVGIAVFDRFTGRRDGTLGYYESLARIFAEHDVPTAPVFDAVVGACTGWPARTRAYRWRHRTIG